MTFYVGREGKQLGPLARDAIVQGLAKGELSADDLGWRAGMPEWIPLGRMPEFSTPPQIDVNPVIAPLADELGSQRRPWIRYWARMLDMALFSYVLIIGLSMTAPSLLPYFESWAGRLVPMALWIGVEAIFMVTCGATPAKALLRITVSNADGSSISFTDAFSRAAEVWVKGLGCGIPMLSVLTLTKAHSRLMTEGTTPWDLSGDFKVRHARVGAFRLVTAAVITVALIALAAWAASVGA